MPRYKCFKALFSHGLFQNITLEETVIDDDGNPVSSVRLVSQPNYGFYHNSGFNKAESNDNIQLEYPKNELKQLTDAVKNNAWDHKI